MQAQLTDCCTEFGHDPKPAVLSFHCLPMIVTDSCQTESQGPYQYHHFHPDHHFYPFAFQRWREARQRDQKLFELHYHFKEMCTYDWGGTGWLEANRLRVCTCLAAGVGTVVWWVCQDPIFAGSVLPEAAFYTFTEKSDRLNTTPELQVGNGMWCSQPMNLFISLCPCTFG